MKIRTAALSAAFLLLGLFTALALYLMRVSDLLDSEARELIVASESIRVAQSLKTRLLIHNQTALLYSLNKDRSLLQTYSDQRRELADLLVRMSNLAGDETEQALIQELRANTDKYLKRLEPQISNAAKATTAVDQAVASADRLIAFNRNQMDELAKKIHRENKTADHLALTMLIANAMILMLLIYLATILVSRPLTRLRAVIAKYAAGEVSARGELKGLDEIQAISLNFNSMADRLENRRQDQLRFLASVAHDLRNPLNSIAMASQLLAERAGIKERELPEIIHRQARHLDRLVGDLLDTTRIESGQLELDMQSCDLSQLIKDAVALHRTTSSLHAFRIDSEIGSIICRCDVRRISQVLNNLLSNAVKYSPNGGLINIGSKIENQKICIAVSDQGLGIAAADLENIFKPFHRTRATKEMIPGIGLGLSASRRIVERHGGELSVQSHPGRGSTFTFTLPL